MIKLIRESSDDIKYKYIAEDRKEIKKYIDKVVSDFVKDEIIPTMNQIYNRISKDHDFMSYEDAEKKNKKGVEVISGEDIAKNIQNLCSFNLDDMNESKRVASKRRSVIESRKPISNRIVKEGVKDVLDNIQAYCDSLNAKYNPVAGDFGIVDCGNGTYQIGIYSKADGRLFGTYSQAMKPRDLVFFIKNVLDIMHVCK